jgi:Prohead core protein serine protease
MAKLITEENYDTEVIIEGSGASKKYFVRGIAAQSGVKNRNGRVYSEALLENAFNDYLRSNPLHEGRAVGELGHSELPKVDESRISHKFVECRKRGPVYEAKALVLNTPMGLTLKGLLEGGVGIGFSTKGTGGLRDCNGYKEVHDYKLCSIADCVHEPSTGLWCNGILENVEFYYNNATSQYEAEAYETVYKKLRRTRVSNLTEVEKSSMFSDFVRLLKS